MLKKLFLILILSSPAFGCLAIYQVPAGRPYETRPQPPRPPMFTANRWECLTESLSYTQFQNSPANGTDTEFYLAIVFVGNQMQFYYYPILYIDRSKLHVYTFGVGQTEIFDYEVEQGTGKVTLDFAPGQGEQVFFEITSN